MLSSLAVTGNPPLKNAGKVARVGLEIESRQHALPAGFGDPTA